MKRTHALSLLIFAGCGGDDAVSTPTPPDAAPGDAAVSDAAAPDGAALDAAADVGCPGCEYEPAVRAADLSRLDGLSFPKGVGERRLNVLLRYPADAPQPLPVIIWSHGGSWNPNGHRLSEAWSQVLASAGYAVLHWAMTPPDSDQLRALCRLVELPDPDDCRDLSLGNPDDEDPEANPFSGTAVTRPGDIAAILDDIAGLAGKIEEDTGVVLDLERIGLAGWSAGSQSVIGAAGAVRIVADSIPPWGRAHPLPTAFVGLSVQPAPQSGFFAGPDGTSWDAVRGPLLLVTGDGDEKPGNDLTGPSRRVVFDLLPPGDKALYYTTTDRGVRHGSFNLADADDPALATFNAGLRSAVLAWFDAHLRDRPEARAWLDAGGAVDAAGGDAEWLVK